MTAQSAGNDRLPLTCCQRGVQVKFLFGTAYATEQFNGGAALSDGKV